LADQKISELTALTGANVADDDAIAIVDTSATETKKIVFSELKNALDTATGFVRITGDTMTGALDVQSTITSDGLTVDGTTNLQGTNPDLYFIESDTTDLNTYIANGSGNFTTYTANDAKSVFKTRINLDHSTGDISFYEDTGTTAKFFWSAADERLGIGTSSPSGKFETYSNAGVGGTNYSALVIDQTNESGAASLSLTSLFTNVNNTNKEIAAIKLGTVTDGGASPSADIRFETISSNTLSERMRITSTGSVGIGTSSPAWQLHVKGTSNAVVQIEGASSAGSFVNFGDPSDTDVGQIGYDHTSNYMRFKTNDTERMRIDSSGNLLVGKTVTSSNTAGGRLSNIGSAEFTRSGGQCLYLNRQSSDGTIASFAKDGTTVGSIGYISSGLYIDGEGGHAGLRFGGADISPRDGGADADAAIQLGSSSNRFTDLYLSGGVYLGGTGSANLLDDYEEGTWTPSLNSGTFSTVGATYTKIGRLVTITLDGTVGTGGGDQITNLPFTTGVTTATALYTSGQNFSSGRTVPMAIVGGGSTTLYFRDIGDNVAFAAMTLTASASITFNITYYVN